MTKTRHLNQVAIKIMTGNNTVLQIIRCDKL